MRITVKYLSALSICAALAVSIAFADSPPKSALDKYTIKVPGGLGFSEFKGYESWQTISLSQSGKLVAVILGNPAMIDAYKAGIPGNGKPVPDGAKMAKIHWEAKKNETAPGQPLVSGTSATWT